jgi:hypothetical protein
MPDRPISYSFMGDEVPVTLRSNAHAHSLNNGGIHSKTTHLPLHFVWQNKYYNTTQLREMAISPLEGSCIPPYSLPQITMIRQGDAGPDFTDFAFVMSNAPIESGTSVFMRSLFTTADASSQGYQYDDHGKIYGRLNSNVDELDVGYMSIYSAGLKATEQYADLDPAQLYISGGSTDARTSSGVIQFSDEDPGFYEPTGKVVANYADKEPQANASVNFSFNNVDGTPSDSMGAGFGYICSSPSYELLPGVSNNVSTAPTYQQYTDTPKGSVVGTITPTRKDGLGDTTVTINDLRQAAAMQLWAERSMRTGFRYLETILSHFGVRVPDYTLQLPEYLGGASSPVSFSEVLQTSSTVAGTSTPQGTMAGHAISASRSRGFKKYFNEHGHIIGVFFIKPRTAYAHAVESNMFKVKDRWDHFWPEFSSLGEQGMYNKNYHPRADQEAKLATTWDDSVYGYEPIYSEYRSRFSRIAGLFKTDFTYWHLAKIPTDSVTTDHSTEYGAGYQMFSASQDYQRIFAVTNSDNFFAHVFFKVNAFRPIPRMAPGGFDHSHIRGVM